MHHSLCGLFYFLTSISDFAVSSTTSAARASPSVTSDNSAEFALSQPILFQCDNLVNADGLHMKLLVQKDSVQMVRKLPNGEFHILYYEGSLPRNVACADMAYALRGLSVPNLETEDVETGVSKYVSITFHNLIASTMTLHPTEKLIRSSEKEEFRFYSNAVLHRGDSLGVTLASGKSFAALYCKKSYTEGVMAQPGQEINEFVAPKDLIMDRRCDEHMKQRRRYFASVLRAMEKRLRANPGHVRISQVYRLSGSRVMNPDGVSVIGSEHGGSLYLDWVFPRNSQRIPIQYTQSAEAVKFNKFREQDLSTAATRVSLPRVSSAMDEINKLTITARTEKLELSSCNETVQYVHNDDLLTIHCFKSSVRIELDCRSGRAIMMMADLPLNQEFFQFPRELNATAITERCEELLNREDELLTYNRWSWLEESRHISAVIRGYATRVQPLLIPGPDGVFKEERIQAVRQVGEELYKLYGFEIMKKVADTDWSLARELDWMWDGIGEWAG